jgi:hypothetical protein
MVVIVETEKCMVKNMWQKFLISWVQWVMEKGNSNN